MRRLSDRARMLWMRALSYRKREWELEDYPIRVRIQENVPENSRFWARILGWNVDGLGRTRVEALAEMRKYFQMQRARRWNEGKPTPRPGTDVPIEFAAHDEIDRHRELADDFIHRVLELEWAFISDESSLWDFHPDGSNGTYYERIREIYGVDVMDIESGNLAEILQRIATQRTR